jgi:hypothetical protein
MYGSERLSAWDPEISGQVKLGHYPIAIVVVSIGCPGEFEARLSHNGRIIVASSRQPLLDSARALLNAGYPSSIGIELWHRGAGA